MNKERDEITYLSLFGNKTVIDSVVWHYHSEINFHALIILIWRKPKSTSNLFIAVISVHRLNSEMDSHKAIPGRSSDGKYKLRQVDRVSYSTNTFQRNPEKNRKASLPRGSEKILKNNLEHDSEKSQKDEQRDNLQHGPEENQKKNNFQRDPNENTILIRHDYLSVSGSKCFKHCKKS